MVFHDWELDRLTHETGEVSERSADELGQMRLGETSDTPLPLSEFLGHVNARVPILVEIKSKPGYDVELSCEAVHQALQTYQGEHAVMSFDPRVSAWFAEHDPRRVRGLVCTDTLDMGWLGKWREEGVLEGCEPDFLACDIRDLPADLSSTWKAAGKPLLSWTVRSPELRSRAMRHADALISEGAGLAETS